MLKEAVFARNDKGMIMIVSETYLVPSHKKTREIRYLDYTRIVRKSSSAPESTSEETCLGNRDYDYVLSLIDDDVFASQQCLSMETIMMEYNGSIGTKQSRIRLMEQRLNSYGGKLPFLHAGYYTQQVVLNKECLHIQCFIDTPSFSEVHREKSRFDPREIGIQMYRRSNTTSLDSSY